MIALHPFAHGLQMHRTVPRSRPDACGPIAARTRRRLRCSAAAVGPPSPAARRRTVVACSCAVHPQPLTAYARLAVGAREGGWAGGPDDAWPARRGRVIAGAPALMCARRALDGTRGSDRPGRPGPLCRTRQEQRYGSAPGPQGRPWRTQCVRGGSGQGLRRGRNGTVTAGAAVAATASTRKDGGGPTACGSRGLQGGVGRCGPMGPSAALPRGTRACCTLLLRVRVRRPSGCRPARGSARLAARPVARAGCAVHRPSLRGAPGRVRVASGSGTQSTPPLRGRPPGGARRSLNGAAGPISPAPAARVVARAAVPRRAEAARLCASE